MTRAVFYISSHGFGHAVRMAEVLRVLLRDAPGLAVDLRTRAPARLFEDVARGIDSIAPVSLDSGVVERGTLQIDLPATRSALAELCRCAEPLIRQEVRYLQQTRPAMIVADIPFLAGPVAQETKIPCVAIGNFTWDWIYEPILEAGSDGSELAEFVRSGYRKMTRWLRLPFSHVESPIPSVTDVPLLVRSGCKSRGELRARIGLAATDRRKVVFLGIRDSLDARILKVAAASSPGFVFLHLHDTASDVAPNTLRIKLDRDLSFVDVMDASDIAVSKLGYGMVAQCIASRTALVFPPRTGFREDELLRQGAARFLRSRPLPLEDYRRGNWGWALREIVEMDQPLESCAVDGADVCAKFIRNMLAEV